MTDTVETVTGAVAQHVRALRLGRGWSLDELSGRSGVSKGMVVQIEAARTNPSIGTLCRIADAFGVTIAQLLEPAADRTVRVTRAADAPLLWRGGYGGFGRLLAGVNEPGVELWEWRLSPHDRYETPEHSPGTRELVHVLNGELTVTIDGAEHVVEPGDTIDFQSDKPHGYRNDGEHPVRLLMVVLLPG
ncbi:MAG: cupin [Actinobacteria bacterium 13_1_20CM_3_71_11]|nr:MAG: cupin [Actinobacteria bacterium 13_1_20CM_3_71_11]TML26383.1 MAG: helix-turn-helix domain-containing protein [Actinomycetota bacterium]